MTADPMTDLRAKAATLPADMSARDRAQALGLGGRGLTPAEFALVQPGQSPVDPTPTDPVVAAAFDRQEQARKEFDAATEAWQQARAMREATERENNATRDAVLGNMYLRPNGTTAEDDAEQRRADRVIRLARSAELQAFEERDDAARRLTRATVAHTNASAAAAQNRASATYAANVAAQEDRLRAAGLHPEDQERRTRRRGARAPHVGTA